MSAPKIFLITVVVAFSALGIVAAVKKNKSSPPAGKQEAKVAVTPPKAVLSRSPVVSVPVKGVADAVEAKNPFPEKQASKEDDFPNIDRIFQLFTTGPTKLPIVETVSYCSSVPWLKGRPAWVADYAAYYGTSRHFIARSLNGRPDYFSQTVSAGRTFNVFCKDKKIQFHLLIDVSRLKMGFYYVDLDTKERVLLKTYKVGLGCFDPYKPSGTLTPLGTYTLGDKIAIYKPGVLGFFQDQKIEMIRVFGTRWIPFNLALGGASEPSKGYGIHGAPWSLDAKTAEMVENRETVGKYESDGCIRLVSEDMEEIFAIVITKPTFVHIVKDFHEAKLPGTEVGTPTR